MSTYHWVISVDVDAERHGDAHSSAGTFGPSGATLTEDQIREHEDRKRFKLYDDDGEHMSSGYYVGPDDETLFAPLEDFGVGNWGATVIKYRNDKTGKYEAL